MIHSQRLGCSGQVLLDHHRTVSCGAAELNDVVSILIHLVLVDLPLSGFTCLGERLDGCAES